MSLGDPLPGLVVQEDLKGLSVGVIGGLSTILIMGTAHKGEILSPQRVSSVNRLLEIFGTEDLWDTVNSPTPLGLTRGVKLALKHSNNVIAMRVAQSGVAAKASAKVLPSKNQYEEITSDNSLIYTIKAIPIVDAVNTTLVASISGSYNVVFDTAPASGQVTFYTSATPLSEGTIEFFTAEQPASGEVIRITFLVDIEGADALAVAVIRGKTEGTWAHDIEFWIEQSLQQATVEEQTIIGIVSTSIYQLLYDDVPKSVVNNFYLSKKTDPSDTRILRPLYYEFDLLNYDGELTDSDDMDATLDQLAQIFKTVDEISIDSLTLSIKSDATADDVTIEIKAVDEDGEPTGSALATGTIAFGDLSASYQDILVNLDTEIILSANTEYAVVISFTYSADTVNVQAIDYNALTNPHYYSNGNYLFTIDGGTTWTDTTKENSLLISIRPILVSGQIGLMMKSWGDPSNLANTARILLSSIETEIITDHNIIAKYRVNPNSNIHKLVVVQGNYREEYIVAGGRDLCRDINRDSAIVEAVEDTANWDLLPSIINNGSESYPVTLTGGNNGAEATPADYLSALEEAKKQEDAYFIVIASAGRYNQETDLASLHANLIAHVRLMSEKGFERIAICGMRARGATETMSDYAENAVDSVATRLDVIADPNGRLEFVGMGNQITDESPQGSGANITLPGAMWACHYAGMRASVDENINTTRKYLNGVIALEFELDYDDKRTLVTLGVVCFESAGGIRVVRGVTTDPNKRFTDASLRRTIDFIYAGQRSILNPLINELNDQELWDTVELLLGNFFDDLTNRRYITENYNLEISSTRDQQNKGIVQVNEYFEPLRPVNKFYLIAKVG